MDENDAPKRGRGRGRRGRVGPNPIDIHVGQRVRLRRTLLGMSQEKLGSALGLTFQQIQKYERGSNRIGASRLYDMSQVLDVPVSFFYDDMTSQLADHANNSTQGFGESDMPSFDPDPMAKRETLELVRAYYRISDESVRKRIFELAKSLAAVSHTRSTEDDSS